MEVVDYQPMPLLIGVNGFKGAGKDTIGAILIEEFGFKRYSFAGKVKEFIAAMWDISLSDVEAWKNDPEYGVAVTNNNGVRWPIITKSFIFRKHMQRVATQAGRDVLGEDIWLDFVLPYKQASTANADKWNYGHGRVFTDVRFDNEFRRIKDLQGYIIRVERPGYGSDGHESELVPDPGYVDYTIYNDHTIEDLRIMVRQVVEKMRINDDQIYGYIRPTK